MPENLIQESRHANAEEQTAHWHRISPDVTRYARLEYARRIALQQNVKLLAEFATVEDRDVKELLSHVISIGGRYIAELERQKESEEIAPTDHLIDLLKLNLDAEWWIDAVTFVYKTPRERERTILDLLQAAANFFRETVDREFTVSAGQQR
jgi:hypothetical protein